MTSLPEPRVRRLAAVWFADVVGYSSLAARDEDRALRLVGLFHGATRDAVEQHHGRVVKFMGDGALAEFPSTDAAARAALRLQQEMMQRADAAAISAELRIGIHVGEVVSEADGDIYGDGVNLASRLHTEAPPGEVICSGDVWRQLRQRSEFCFHALGERDLKGMAERIAVFRLTLSSEEQEFPETRTDDPVRTAEVHLPDADRVRRASLAHLRHELRTPINAIIGYSEMLLEDVAALGQPETLADLRTVHGAGKQLLPIVDSILHPDNAPANRATQGLGAFQAQLRRDLREPLNAVIGYSEILIESSAERNCEDLLPDLERILGAAKNVLGLTNDVVQLSEVGNGDAEPNARFSLASAMAEEVLAKIQPLDRDPLHDAGIHEGCLLVVDDNEVNRDLLSRQLARAGYSIYTAENGREALELVGMQDFDLVLLDIMMPEIDGFEVLRNLKSDEALRDIPVIMISALDEIDSAVRCIEMGAEDYLSKPFDPVLLKARIGANLRIRRMRDREHAIAEQLRSERELTARLLRSAFPAPIAERIRAGESRIADSYPEATALWAEFESFGRLSTRSGPAEFVERLDSVFSLFGQIAGQLGLETFKVTGQACVVVGGVPTPRDHHADAIAEMALRMAQETRREAAQSREPLHLRIGVHTGPLIAGILGKQRLAYDVWGDAVDTARRLHSHCAPGSILVSPAAYLRLRNRYRFQNKGVVELAGKGQMLSYMLQGKMEPSRSAI